MKFEELKKELEQMDCVKCVEKDKVFGDLFPHHIYIRFKKIGGMVTGYNPKTMEGEMLKFFKEGIRCVYRELKNDKKGGTQKRKKWE